MKSKPNSSSKSRPGVLPAVTATLALLGFISPATAQLQLAGDLFVNVDATSLTEGPLSSIVNSGTLGGLFEARGGGTTVPAITTIGGVKAITFDGTDFMQLVGELGGAVTPPPDGLVGGNPSRTIEVWAYNPSIADEETLVSWGKRGGGDGSNMSFNYGSNGTWGAVGQWGSPDIGWANDGGAPAARAWHHLVYTYDGAIQRVFSDGILLNEEAVSLNTHPNTSIVLAAQLEGDGVTVTGGLRGSLSLGKVRIHNDALTPEQVKQNFDLEKTGFSNLPAPLPLSSAPIHRYSFNETAAPDAAGLTFNDSVGTAHGTVRGAGTSFSGTRLALSGGSNAEAGYGDLPNGLLSANSANNGGSGQITVEGWVKVTGNQFWSRVFDFGNATAGEVTGPQGGVGPGLGSLFYTAQIGNDLDNHRTEVPGAGVNTPGGATPGEDFHFAITWDENTREVRTYANGVLQNSFSATGPMSAINDVNVWLGRSQYDDANMQGEFDEFRIYNRVLTAREVAGNFGAGPEVVNLSEDPVSFVSQPNSITNFESFRADFEAVATGAAPLTYQWYRDDVAITGATGPSYGLVTSVADNGARLYCVAANTPNGVPTVVTSVVATLTVRGVPAPTLKNQYTFNEAAGLTVATDVVGGKDGAVVGNGAYADGKLTLDGSSAYVNLPNGLVSAYNSITVEAWVQDDGSAGWARIFDFGNSSNGEDFAIGAPGSGGTQYMFLSAPSGFGNLRGAYTVSGGGAGEQLIEQAGASLPVGQMKHVVWTTSGDAKAGRLYVDGVQVAENRNVTITPAALGTTVNNWLGRAQFNDPLFRGQFDEFRIWDGFMLPGQVASSFAAGPSTAPIQPRMTIVRDGNNVVVSWPDWATFAILEEASSLLPADWHSSDGQIVQEAGFFKVTLPVGANPKFFRLVP